jgi:hypothetical protein
LLEAHDPAAVHLGYAGDPTPLCFWTVDPTIVHEPSEVTCKLCLRCHSNMIAAELGPQLCDYDYPGTPPEDCGKPVVEGTDFCEEHQGSEEYEYHENMAEIAAESMPDWSNHS